MRVRVEVEGWGLGVEGCDVTNKPWAVLRDTIQYTNAFFVAFPCNRLSTRSIDSCRFNTRLRVKGEG